MLLFSMHSIEDLSQHFGLSSNKYLDVQMQELPTEDLCKTSSAAEKDALEAIVVIFFGQFVVQYQVY